MVIGQIVLSFNGVFTESTSLVPLYVGVSFTAFAFGSTWCLIGPVTSDIVGQRNFGKIYATVSMASMASTFLFNQV